MPVKSGPLISSPEAIAPQSGPHQTRSQQWEYLELLVGVGNEIWDSNGHKSELREIQVGDPRFPRHYYSAAPLLNELGRDGWEVAGIIGDLSTYILELKRLRPVADAPAAEVAETAEVAVVAEPTPPRRSARTISQRIQGEPK